MPSDKVPAFSAMVNELVYLQAPKDFHAVGQVNTHSLLHATTYPLLFTINPIKTTQQLQLQQPIKQTKQFYQRFDQTADEEVLDLLKLNNQECQRWWTTCSDQVESKAATH